MCASMRGKLQAFVGGSTYIPKSHDMTYAMCTVSKKKTFLKNHGAASFPKTDKTGPAASNQVSLVTSELV